MVQQRDLDSKRGKHGGVFQSDNSRTHNHKIARHFFQTMHLIGVIDSLAVNRNIGTVRRTRTAGNHHVLAANHLGSVITLDFDGMRIGEARVSFEGRYVVPAELSFDYLDLSEHDSLGAKGQIRHRDAILEHVPAAIESALAEAAQVQHRFSQSLAGNRPGMNADTADGSLPVNDRHLLTHLGGANGCLLACRSAADHYQVVFISFHR